MIELISPWTGILEETFRGESEAIEGFGVVVAHHVLHVTNRFGHSLLRLTYGFLELLL